MKRIFGFLVLVGLVALSGFSPASADQPLHFGPFHYELTDGVLTDCGAFQVLITSEYELRGTAFFDEDGNVDRALVDFYGTDTYINSVTGKSFSDTFHYKSIYEFERNTITDVGVAYRLTVPGEGAVLLHIGRIVFQMEPPFNVIFEAGPHLTGVGDFAGLCAAMA